ncbi:MAG: DMT family transporter [Pseudomonadota bacterium]
MTLALLAALVCGLLLSAQPILNGALARAVASPGTAAMISLLVSALMLAPFATAGGGPDLSGLGSIPWWAWLGGLAGAAFVAGGIGLAPVIGLAVFLSVVVAGQLLGALVIEGWGLFGAARNPISASRVLGLLLVLGGVLVFRFGRF